MTRLMRIPNDSAKEIESIAKQYGVTISAAFKIWKENKIRIKWKNC